MEPRRPPVRDLDDAPPPVVPEDTPAVPTESVQSGVAGPSAVAEADAAPSALEPAAPRATAGDKFKAPAQSPARGAGDMLAPAAADADAAGAPGIASEIPAAPATHRSLPLDQGPEPSEHFTPPVPDDRALKIDD